MDNNINCLKRYKEQNKMKDGFIKVASGTPDIKVADCEYNRAEITALIDKAHSRGVKILVLPELCVTGYTCQDLFF